MYPKKLLKQIKDTMKKVGRTYCLKHVQTDKEKTLYSYEGLLQSIYESKPISTKFTTVLYKMHQVI